MKIIISHDIDHISMNDHWVNDLFIPKWVVKTILYVVLGKLPVRIGLKRLALVLSGRLHRVPEVMEIDRKFNIPSTFFVGMRNGLGMSYSLRKARQMLKLIQGEGFEVGVHVVAYDNAQLIREEYDRFVSIVGKDHLFGVRNHYLRFNTQTPAFQSEAGYLFDSSDYGIKAPYRVKGLVEFPVCLMDSYLLSDGQNDLEDVKRRTLEAFQMGEKLELPYFTIIFHDVYFSDLFPEHQAWYQWVVQYVREHYDVTDFVHAIEEMKAT
jgi:peptidoglycan/xylan/chitin deacetylase (PgdA/CDA1 family)